jgi:hypothetical protein
MRRTFLLTGLLLALAFILPTRAADDKKTDDKKTDKPGDKLVNKTDLNGKLVHVEGAGKGFRVQVQVPKLDQNVVNTINNLKGQLARTNPRDFNQIANLERQITQNQAKMYTSQGKDVDIDPGEDMKVVSKNPPVAFDDKGKIKKYTAKELAELRDAPGSHYFKADFDSLKNGQLVTVTVGWKKDSKPPKPGQEKDPDWLAENKPIAIKIIIVAEPMDK